MGSAGFGVQRFAEGLCQRAEPVRTVHSLQTGDV